MLSKLRSYPLYLILLPVFFVLHGFLENYGFISVGEGALLTLIYTLCTLAVAIVCWLLLRTIPKAVLVAFIVMVIYFFFGALHDFLKEHTPSFFSRYIVLLSVFFLIIVATIVYLKKKNPSLTKLTAFLNLLFIIYLFFDVSSLVSKYFRPAGTGLSVYSFAKDNTYQPCDTCQKPDIYFLLMDGYASSLALERYQYHNELDSFLRQRKFGIQANSRSNYNFTPFSMASILNMSYLKGITNPKQVTVTDYSNCEALIRNNEVIKTLNAAGYDIVNYSIFNLAGHPTLVEQTILPLNTRLITERTLLACIRKDLGWQLATWYPFKWFWGSDIMNGDRNNQRFIELVKTSAATPHTKPRFVYAHFFLPHIPYYYDKNGKLRNLQTIIEENTTFPVAPYLEYVTYANSRIREMITSIQQKDPTAVIILMGDHGHREDTKEAFPVRYFMNLNAVYYPDNDYKELYDSISGVNQFRVVFNKLFKQKLPLLPDSSIYLQDQVDQPGAAVQVE